MSKFAIVKNGIVSNVIEAEHDSSVFQLIESLDTKVVCLESLKLDHAQIGSTYTEENGFEPIPEPPTTDTGE